MLCEFKRRKFHLLESQAEVATRGVIPAFWAAPCGNTTSAVDQLLGFQLGVLEVPYYLQITFICIQNGLNAFSRTSLSQGN